MIAPTYTNRFTAQAMSLLDKTYVLNIKQKDYTGSATEVTASAIPFVRSLKGDEDVIEDLILRSAFKISLEDENEGTFRELFTYDWKKFIVEIWKDDVIYWTGFLTADYYSEPWTNSPYTISFTAHDGLGQLMNIDFLHTLYDGTPGAKFTDKISLAEVVAQCLWKIMPFYYDRAYDGHGIGGLFQTGTVYEGINIFEEHQDHDKSMLTETFIQAERFYQDGIIDCYTALYEVLKLCNAQILQKDGYWWIVSLGSRKDSFTYKKYTITETFVSDVSTLTWVLSDSGTYDPNVSVSGVNKWYEEPVMTILPAWKEFTIKQNLGYKDNVFFTEDFIKSVNPNIVEYQEGDVISYAQLGSSRRGNYVCPEHTILYRNSNQDSVIFRLGYFEAVDDQTIKIDIDFSKNVRKLAAQEESSVAFRIYIQSGATIYWLYQTEWHTDSHDFFAVTIHDNKLLDCTYSVESSGFPIDGYLNVEVVNLVPVIGQTQILIQKSCFKIEVVGQDIVESLEVITHINDKQNYIPDTREMMFGDFIDVDNKVRVYCGGLWYKAGEDSYGVTENWHITDSTVLKPLINLIADEIGILHTKPVWMLSGDLIGEFDPLSTITDTHADRKFILIRFDEDVYGDEWNVDLVEIAPEESGFLKLKQGGYLLLKGGGKIKLRR